jgi:hypothetical protein
MEVVGITISTAKVPGLVGSTYVKVAIFDVIIGPNVIPKESASCIST